MSFFQSMDISASGLSAQKMRMDVISQNIANVNTTRTENGTPYKRKIVLFEERKDASSFAAHLNSSLINSSGKGGVRATKIVEDQREGSKVYEPSHPDADKDGYVTMPNVNVVEEMTNMISASRSYEANVTSIGITKSMIAKTLEISR